MKENKLELLIRESTQLLDEYKRTGLDGLLHSHIELCTKATQENDRMYMDGEIETRQEYRKNLERIWRVNE